MRIFYTLLGMFARIGQELSRIRINLVPLNWVAMISLTFLTIFGFTNTYEGLHNSDKPRSVSLTDIVSRKEDTTRNYVTIHGLLGPPLFSRTEQEKYSSQEKVTDVYVPFIDKKGQKGILIEMRPEDAPSEDADFQEVSLTGMVKTMQGEVQKHVREDADLQKLAREKGLIFDQEYQLENGATPGNASLWFPIAGLSALGLLALFSTFLMRYIVFQKTGEVQRLVPEMTTPPQGNLSLRATGNFHLSKLNSKRFLDMPAGIMVDNDGSVFLVSNIDASRSFMGIRLVSLAGYWTIPLGQADNRNVEYGRLYLGLGSRPAIKIPFQGYDGKKDTAIVTLENEAERDLFMNILRQKKGTQTPLEPVTPTPVTRQPAPVAAFDLED